MIMHIVNTPLDVLIVLVINIGDEKAMGMEKIESFAKHAKFLFICTCMYRHT